MYEKLDYERALRQLEKAEAKATTPSDERQVALVSGIVMADAGKANQATTAFLKAFSTDVDAPLPIEVSPKIIKVAEAAREKVRRAKANPGKPLQIAPLWLSSPQLCSEVDVEVERVWNESTRTQVLERFQQAQSDVAGVAKGLISRLDDWASLWADQRLALCLRDKVRHELSEPTVAAREACLQRASDAFNALVTLLTAETTTGNAIMNVTSRLPDPRDCTQTVRPGVRFIASNASEQKAQQQLNQAIALSEVGKHKEANALLETARQLGASSKNATLKVDIAYLDAVSKSQAGDSVSAIEGHSQAVALSLESGLTSLAIRSLLNLVGIYGFKENLASAERTYRWAIKLLNRENNYFARSILESRWGSALASNRKTEQARKAFQTAVKFMENAEQSTVTDYEMALALHNLGMANWVLANDGKSTFLPESIEAYERGIQKMLSAFGYQAPMLVSLYMGLGRSYFLQGEVEKAEPILRSSISLAEALKTPTTKRPAAYLTIADVYFVTGQLELAETNAKMYLEALTSQEANYKSKRVIDVLCLLGDILRERGETEKAIETHQRALTLSEQFSGYSRHMVLSCLAIDYATAQKWNELPQLTNECMKGIKADTSCDIAISCKSAHGQQLWALGSKSEARANMKKLLTPAKTETRHDALFCDIGRRHAREWLEGHSQ